MGFRAAAPPKKQLRHYTINRDDKKQKKTSDELNNKYEIVHRCVLQCLKIKVCRPMQEVLKLKCFKLSNFCRVQFLQRYMLTVENH